jgi:glutathione S-transferase
VTLTLHHGSAGACSLATHIALEEAGAEYSTIHVDLASGEQRKPDFLKINPKGRVPVVVTEDGSLTENTALLLYVAQKFPGAGLAPLDDLHALARLQAFNAYLASTVHVAHAHKLRGSRWSDDAAAIETMKLKVAQNMTDCAATIEYEYLAGPWVMGKDYTVADAYLHVMTRWMLGDGVDLARFPKLSAHHEAMQQRPAVKRVMAFYG